MRTTRQWMVTRALLASLAVVALAACGGASGADDQVATLGDSTAGDAADDGDGAGAGEELTDAEREDAMLEFSECMRENGVDLPDPGSGDSGRVIAGGPDSGSRIDQEAFQEANEACGSLLEDAFGDRPQLSPEEEAEMQDNALAFAECMREHGIDMPDPTFGEGPGGGFSISVGGPGGGGGERLVRRAAIVAVSAFTLVGLGGGAALLGGGDGA
ncbi:MAG: hypothetical protein ABL966_14185, partial [Acidimicrobiales bacterium]